MTDREAARQKARVKKYLDKWYEAGFGWWRITYVWDRSYNTGNDEVAAECSAHWQYRTAQITFFLPVIQETKDEDELERIVVHELCHVLIASTQNFETSDLREMTEYATENVTKALMWAAKNIKEAK